MPATKDSARWEAPPEVKTAIKIAKLLSGFSREQQRTILDFVVGIHGEKGSMSVLNALGNGEQA